MVSTSEVEELGNSGTVLLYVYMQIFCYSYYFYCNHQVYFVALSL